jgi:flagellar biosynthesis/type III secretory pathway chaperone
MANSMFGLITCLSENEKVLTELAFSLKEEQRCIVEMDLPSLEENSGRKEEITARLIHVRAECGALMQQAGCELGISEIPSLSTLIAAAAATDQTKLRPLQQRLMMLAQALERQHDMNRRMLENSIVMIKNSMVLFGRLLGGCDTYGAQGQINNGRSSGSFLRQEL